MIDRLPFEEGTITIEYQLAPNMVVFSHDFGTQRDGHGLLSEIAAQLPAHFGYILFDYYDIDLTGKYVQMKSFTDQIHRLETVIAWLRARQEVQKVHIIAHSFGCVVAAKLKPANIATMQLLAPPTLLGDDFERYSELAAGKEVAGIWKLHRADGVTISIPTSFLGELKVVDCEAELTQLASKTAYLIILPSNDELMNDVDYTELIVLPTVHAVSTDNTNHYFEGNGRAQLMSVIDRYLIDPEANSV